MKIGRISTIWKVISLSYSTCWCCIRLVLLQLCGTSSRPKYDKVIHTWADTLLHKLRVRCEVINPYKVQPEAGRATIIMCNHASLYDIPLAFKAFPHHSIRMLAKKELARVPILGKGMAAAEFPFVDRKNRYQAIKDLAFAKQLMESGIVIWIAPEGTRSKDGKLAPFKKGGFITAIESGAVIIPMGIKGAYDILPAHSFNLYLDQKAEIHVGKPIDAAEYALKDREALMHRTYQAIHELVN